MNAITTTNDPSHAQMMESVLADGDLGKLSVEQRVAYYFKVCESLGLNPYTRPFDYITLNGKKVLYAKRDCTDQLRNIRGITLTVTDKRQDDDLFVVTVRATDARGRSDEDFGAVPMNNLKGEARANAMLKAITKAKRRVTLSICGMGMNDETEQEHLPGAVIENIELPPPSQRDQINADVSLRAAAAEIPRAPTVRGPAVYTDEQWKAWLVKTRSAMLGMRTLEEVDQAAERESIANALNNGPEWVVRDVRAILAEARGRFIAAPDDGDAAHEPVEEGV